MYKGTMKKLLPYVYQTESDFEKRRPLFCQRHGSKQDEFGFDLQVFARTELYMRFLFEDYFQVKLFGIENIPSEGSAIIAGNHNGVLPLDGFMLWQAAADRHPSQRLVRFLAHDCCFWGVNLRKLMSGIGSVPATYKNAKTLLNRGELVGIYPGAERAMGVPFDFSYKVSDFHRAFVKLAIETQSPIIPVATVGNIETYPLIGNSKSIAKLFDVPFFWITPFFPLLPFPISWTPLPVKWAIFIGKPIHLEYTKKQAGDRELIDRITLEFQEYIQQLVNEMLSLRKSPLKGWDDKELSEWALSANHEFAART